MSPGFAVNAGRLATNWQTLSTFRDIDQPGWTRRPFTDEYRAARRWLKEQMQAAGLSTEVDAGGNLIGRRPGSAPGLPSILIGSHTDTVLGGGRFDGIVGVLGAIEVARSLAEQDVQLRRSLEVIDFLAEEPTDFGISTVGSRALVGSLSSEMLNRESNGRTLAEAIESVGGRPQAIGLCGRQPGSVALYLELHIEQGPVLEQEQLRLGVVTSITGICRYRVELVGRADHAGTMPMARRRDALAAAAECIVAVERLWQDGGGVGTTGRALIEPNATNVIPGRVELWVEQRSVDPDRLQERCGLFVEQVQSIASRRDVAVRADPLSYEAPVPVPDALQALLADVLTEVGQSVRYLPSYAGHDANQLARVAPVGMLFVPSHAGRSHCPEEWTDLADVALGAQALGLAVIRADGLMS